MAKFYFLLLFVFSSYASSAQDSLQKAHSDTTRSLPGVTVRGYLMPQPVMNVPASVSIVPQEQLRLQPQVSLLPVLNALPGVRMEERSPGSYRLSIRGSQLRSPFGVRDVKIYDDELPLTDAGGNTYLNAIDVTSIQHIEVMKGPDGSLFGANSGGVVLISPVNRYADSSYRSLEVTGGSYGLFHESAGVQASSEHNQLNINEAYQTAAGYRQNSAMSRTFVQADDRLGISQKDQLKLLGFFSNLDYQTPGGLTLTQFQSDPTLARTSTKTLPGALSQHTGIAQKMLFGGGVNEWRLSGDLLNVSSVFGSYVDFSNPFITTYNQRYEGTFGFRSFFEWAGGKDNSTWKLNAGVEWQQTNSDINSYGNKHGIRDTPQALDEIHTNQHFFFTRYLADFNRRLHFEAALSMNFYDYQFRNLFPHDEPNFSNRHFSPQLMPRIAVSYQIFTNWVWRGSASRGYSTPTTAEIRPTDQAINTALGAEDGWNYETGVRIRNPDQSFYVDLSIFYYRMSHAILPQQDLAGGTYYINAGGTKQPGAEIYVSDWIVKQSEAGILRGLQLNVVLSLYRFTFSDYRENGHNYTGNQITGVPDQVLAGNVLANLAAGFYIFSQYNYTARLPLNDANTVFATSYHLLQAKIGWERPWHKIRLALYAGADNMLNEKYSLGNDLNAVGGRYYNPAPRENYYFGCRVAL